MISDVLIHSNIRLVKSSPDTSPLDKLFAAAIVLVLPRFSSSTIFSRSQFVILPQATLFLDTFFSAVYENTAAREIIQLRRHKSFS